VSGLHGQDDLPRLVVSDVEVNPAVDPLVRALFLFDRTRADESERPDRVTRRLLEQRTLD
jgi:hypothetical protein